MKYQYHIDGTLPMNEPIFVFGSNESGIHGAGAARVARDLYGAKLGVGFGPMGRCWAIPTKNWKVESLDLDAVRHYIKRFKEYAASSTEQFFITRVGCGLAGWPDIRMKKLRRCLLEVRSIAIFQNNGNSTLSHDE